MNPGREAPRIRWTVAAADPRVPVMAPLAVTVAADAPVGVARAVAYECLRGLPARWGHSVAVATRAEELAVTVDPTERDTLVAAAWLHDIGYGPALHLTGFHPLDGALHLQRRGWPDRVCALVAHHSGAWFVAGPLGLRTSLDRYLREASPVSDALAYADQTVGPEGQRLPIRHRLAEAVRRHGPGSAQARVHAARQTHLLAVATRVEQRLRRARPRAS
jgi:hypothetical protein